MYTSTLKRYHVSIIFQLSILSEHYCIKMSESENKTLAVGTVIDNTDSISDDTEESLTELEEHEFNMKTWRTDLTLLVEDKVLHVGKLVLALVSPVFEAMFNGEYKEKYADELPLPEKKFADVLEFLQCIYPNIMKPVTLANVYRVLPLADEYQVSKLKADCESCLLGRLSKDISTVSLYDLLTKAKRFNLPRVYTKGMNIAADRPHTDLDDVENEVERSDDIMSEIRVRMLHSLDIRYKNTSSQISTSRALCKFLGAKAKEKDLSDQYLEGRVIGDCGSLCVSSPYDNSTINLNVSGILYTVHTSSNWWDLKVSIECSHTGQYNTNCLGEVVVNNWMKGKDDIIKTDKREFNSSSNPRGRMSLDISLGTIENETAGFIYEGNVNIDVFLFSISETP